ncbi:MAG: competence type IV pilus major pilin ComGC [Verrucomicrobiia bacterium]|jgi:prepilin-type N-terminal cleavage/methylation domain-containing protein
MRFLPTSTHRNRGFSLIELAIVVAVLGVVAMIAMPNLFSARKSAEVKICITNLRAIDHAKQQWGFENGKSDADKPLFSDIEPYLTSRQLNNICPLGGKYEIKQMKDNPTCEYSAQGHILVE